MWWCVNLSARFEYSLFGLLLSVLCSSTDYNPDQNPKLFSRFKKEQSKYPLFSFSFISRLFYAAKHHHPPSSKKPTIVWPCGPFCGTKRAPIYGLHSGNFKKNYENTSNFQVDFTLIDVAEELESDEVKSTYLRCWVGRLFGKNFWKKDNSINPQVLP